MKLRDLFSFILHINWSGRSVCGLAIIVTIVCVLVAGYLGINNVNHILDNVINEILDIAKIALILGIAGAIIISIIINICKTKKQ